MISINAETKIEFEVITGDYENFKRNMYIHLNNDWKTVGGINVYIENGVTMYAMAIARMVEGQFGKPS
jgi:hypothetical protein